LLHRHIFLPAVNQFYRRCSPSVSCIAAPLVSASIL
jgi:hypothetical protein